jgi:hypothetical protein
MAINLNAIRSLLLPGLDTIFGDYPQIKTQWKEIFEQKTSDMAYERDFEFKKFGLGRSAQRGRGTHYDEPASGELRLHVTSATARLHHHEVRAGGQPLQVAVRAERRRPEAVDGADQGSGRRPAS